MKVKVNDTIVDSDIDPLMLIFTEDQRFKMIEILSNLEKQDEYSIVMHPENMDIKTVEKLVNNSDDYKENFLRLSAEFENFKRRTNKEKLEIKDSTKVDILSSILDMDSELSLAIKQIKNEDDKKGVELIISKMDKFFKEHDIIPIQTEIYDSNLHEVIGVVNSESEKIIDVVSKGYTLGGKPFKYPKIVLGKVN